MLYGLIVSMVVFGIAVAVAFAAKGTKNKTKQVVTPINAMFVGTFLSAAAMFFPIYFAMFAGAPLWEQIEKSLTIGMHHAIRLFVIDSDFEIIQDAAATMVPAAGTVFSVFATVLYIVAPLLTFGFVLSFFKNISAYWRYVCRYFSDVYVFSELNERSLALAESLLRNNEEARKNKKSGKVRGRVIMFADVFEKNEEESYDLVEKARTLGGICFKKDITSINLKFHSKNTKLMFFAIGDDETENIQQTFTLMKAYENRDNTMIYLFSNRVEGELIMTAAKQEGGVKVRRINDVRSLVYRTLYDMEMGVIAAREAGKEPEGGDLFTSAKRMPDGSRQIGAVLLGCGMHGTEMLKTLSWFCQMDGYRVSIDAFDRDEKAKSRFSALCPELMHPNYNGVYVDGEAQYFIDIHGGIDVDTIEFIDEIKKLTDTTYVFISLGRDDLNVKAAITLRTVFEQMHIHPIIHAVVTDSDIKKNLMGVSNHKGKSYDITMVGDLETMYSEEVVLSSELERKAYKDHIKGGYPEAAFWNYEYNYRSSIASALHIKARIACGIAGAGKEKEQLTEEEQMAIEKLEHCRWNAYMRSEGFVYSGSKDPASRNDMGKMHHNLVTYDELTEEDKRKDARAGT